MKIIDHTISITNYAKKNLSWSTIRILFAISVSPDSCHIVFFRLHQVTTMLLLGLLLRTAEYFT